jgi:hypothetical protein
VHDVRTGGSFDVIHMATAVKVDVLVAGLARSIEFICSEGCR